jgi:hypothetical protein
MAAFVQAMWPPPIRDLIYGQRDPRLVSPAALFTCATILLLSGIHSYRFSAGWQ